MRIRTSSTWSPRRRFAVGAIKGTPWRGERCCSPTVVSESVGETRLRVFHHQVGLPAPELQCDIVGSDSELMARIDLAHLTAGTLIEFDGMAKYGAEPASHRTRSSPLREATRGVSARRRLECAPRGVGGSRRSGDAEKKWANNALQRGKRSRGANPIAGSVRLLPPIQMPR